MTQRSLHISDDFDDDYDDEDEDDDEDDTSSSFFPVRATLLPYSAQILGRGKINRRRPKHTSPPP